MKIRALVALCFMGILLGQSHAQKSGNTNVLLIAIDDLNDWVGFMGGRPQRERPIWMRWPSGGEFSRTPTARFQYVRLRESV